MCQRRIHAALAGTGDNEALDNRNSGENTIGINVDAPAVTVSPSTGNNKPPSIATTRKKYSSSDSKGSSRGGEETSSGNESKENKAEKEKEKWAKIRKGAKQIQKDNQRRWKAAKAKGNVYEGHINPDETGDDFSLWFQDPLIGLQEEGS